MISKKGKSLLEPYPKKNDPVTENASETDTATIVLDEKLDSAITSIISINEGLGLGSYGSDDLYLKKLMVLSDALNIGLHRIREDLLEQQKSAEEREIRGRLALKKQLKVIVGGNS